MNVVADKGNEEDTLLVPPDSDYDLPVHMTLKGSEQLTWAIVLKPKNGGYHGGIVKQVDLTTGVLRAEPENESSSSWICCATVEYLPSRSAGDEFETHAKHPAQKQLLRFAVPPSERLKEVITCLYHSIHGPVLATVFITPGYALLRFLSFLTLCVSPTHATCPLACSFFCVACVDERFLKPTAIPWELVDRITQVTLLTVEAIEVKVPHYVKASPQVSNIVDDAPIVLSGFLSNEAGEDRPRTWPL